MAKLLNVLMERPIVFRKRAFLLLLLVSQQTDWTTCQQDGAAEQSIRELFNTLDQNHDGQIEQQEAINYIGQIIGGSEYDTQQELSDAAHLMASTVDGVDDGVTISRDEFDSHLHNVLQVINQPT